MYLTNQATAWCQRVDKPFPGFQISSDHIELIHRQYGEYSMPNYVTKPNKNDDETTIHKHIVRIYMVKRIGIWFRVYFNNLSRNEANDKLSDSKVT